MSEWWRDEESGPASWLPGDEPGPDDDPAQLPADAEPWSYDDPPPAEPPSWLTDESCESAEAEHAAWLASLPADIRADYLAGPYTGAGEAIAPGFTHHDAGGPSGAGFAAGGALDQMDPGPWLAQALADSTAPGCSELTDSEQIGVLCAWQRQAAWAQAGLARAALALARRRENQAAAIRNRHLIEHVPDEIGAALTLTTLSANRLLAAAAGLARLPEVDAALSAGQIDWTRACLITEELAILDSELARQIAARLLAAGRLTTSQLRARLRREVLAADPDAARRRKAEGRKDTRVDMWDEPSGNNVLAGRELRPADAIAADIQLTADARWLRDNGVPGTLAELRAAAFIARLSGRDLTTLLPRPAGGSPGSPGGADSRTTPGGSINLTMPLSSFAGLGDSPGEAAGHGAVDADSSRELAALAGPGTRWCLTLTGPDGRAVAHACARRGHAPEAGTPAIRWAAGLRDRLQFLEKGGCSHPRQTAAYAWPASLRHLIEIRQRACAAPGCRRPAARCDIDHTIPFEKGGLTCECNGSPLCRRHHRCKQAPGWGLTQDYPGHLTWRTPGDRAYTTTGDPYPG